jgi:predicted enzyme related to lactoylglutathione lyase
MLAFTRHCKEEFMANSVVHFEIFATDVERTRKFYEQVFGWSFEAGGPPDFYHITTGPNSERGLTQGLIAKRRGPASDGPINSFRCTIRVTAIHETSRAIEAAGGKMRSPVIDIPGVGKVAEFTDTDGNIVCVMEFIPTHEFAK